MRPPRLGAALPSSTVIVDGCPRAVFVPLSKDRFAHFATLIDSRVDN
jgi:hypothetical protein